MKTKIILSGFGIIVILLVALIIKSKTKHHVKLNPKIEIRQDVTQFNENDYQVVTKVYQVSDQHKKMVRYIDTWCTQHQIDSIKQVQIKSLQHSIDSLNNL